MFVRKIAWNALDIDSSVTTPYTPVLPFSWAVWSSNREAYLSTQQACPCSPPRLSRSYGHRRGTPCPVRTPLQGPQAPVSLILSALPADRGNDDTPDGRMALPSDRRYGASGLRTMMIGRLTRRSEFLRVAGLRCKWATPGLILQAAPAVEALLSQPSIPEIPAPAASEPGTSGSLRVGFTCSKKVGNAVARNRAKRRLRAAAAAVLPLHATPGYDYVLIGRQETLRRPFALLLQDLQTALKRVCADRRRSSADRPPPARQSGQEAS